MSRLALPVAALALPVAALALAALPALTGCSDPVDRQAAERAVQQFHRQLDAGQYDAIYTAAAPDLRNGVTRAQFVALASAVHARMGATQSSKEQHWRRKVGPTDSADLAQQYLTRYAAGEVHESFTWRMKGDEARLVEYKADLPPL